MPMKTIFALLLLAGTALASGPGPAAKPAANHPTPSPEWLAYKHRCNVILGDHWCEIIDYTKNKNDLAGQVKIAFDILPVGRHAQNIRVVAQSKDAGVLRISGLMAVKASWFPAMPKPLLAQLDGKALQTSCRFQIIDKAPRKRR